MKYSIISPETDQKLASVEEKDLANFSVQIESHRVEIATTSGERRLFHGTVLADSSILMATALGNLRMAVVRGELSEAAGGGKGGHKPIKSSMPGKVLKIFCKPGDKVTPGQPLLIIEAMKMENEIASPIGGVVEEIAVQVGKSIQTGELLVKLGAGEK